MFPYCCLLITCFFFILCSVFKVHRVSFIILWHLSLKRLNEVSTVIEASFNLLEEFNSSAQRIPYLLHSSFLTIHSKAKLLKWWAKVDSNHRPHDYQSCALASWAIGPRRRKYFSTLVRFLWWRLAGSNRWPPACKAGALPAELNPHVPRHTAEVRPLN